MWAMGLVLLGSPIVVHLAGAGELPVGAATEVLAEIARGVERASHRSVAIDDSTACEGDEDCGREIGARFATDDVVLVNLFGAVRTGRASARLVARNGEVTRRVDLEYPLRDRSEWLPIFSGLGGILFPRDSMQTASSTRAEVIAVIEEPSPVGPIFAWTALAVGAAAGGVATGLRVHSNAIRDDVRTMDGLDPVMQARLEDRSNAYGLGSNLLFGAGAVCVVSAIVYLVTR